MSVSIDSLAVQLREDKAAASLWARELLEKGDFILLDTETTGLGYDDEAVHIAVVAPDGSVLFDSLIHPTIPIPEGATDVHGITNEQVADAPPWQDVAPQLVAAIGTRRVIAYNAQYDERIISQSAYAVGDSAPNFGRWECAMLEYAKWFGQWNDYHGSYRWRKLPTSANAHSAIADCRAVLTLLKMMAGEGE